MAIRNNWGGKGYAIKKPEPGKIIIWTADITPEKAQDKFVKSYGGEWEEWEAAGYSSVPVKVLEDKEALPQKVRRKKQGG